MKSLRYAGYKTHLDEIEHHAGDPDAWKYMEFRKAAGSG